MLFLVKSPSTNSTLSIGSIFFKSIDSIFPFLILFDAYCDQLPGAAPRSINEIPFFIILNF